MSRLASGICLSLLAFAVARPAAADARADLALALTSYDAGQYAAAISAATVIPATDPDADAAQLVIGRAHLEQFRQTRDPVDLAAARTAFQALHPAKLGPHDRLQLLVGLGESLYLDGMFGPASQLFGAALQNPGPFAPGEHDRLLDWWATAVDREAQQKVAGRREPLYRRLADRMRDVRREDPASGVAAYWTVAAERSAGDLDAAWNAAVAYWVRAPLMGARAATLRANLDRLMLAGIIPERARQLATTPNDEADVAADLRAAWEVVKKQWGGD